MKAPRAEALVAVTHHVLSHFLPLHYPRRCLVAVFPPADFLFTNLEVRRTDAILRNDTKGTAIEREILSVIAG